ncbi:MAG TPA: SAF domain-containing protein [Acidimicrobiales bacterium]|nr:SAF domain-containing protein [Acidimicrobiales bacterium]
MSDGNGRSERSRGTVATTGPRLARVRRAALPTSTNPEGLPARRQWARVAAGAALALLGGWIFASLYVSAGERVEVLAVAEQVDRFETIEADDLRTVRVAADPGVETIDADQADELVGRAAATDLLPGSLLSPAQVVPADTRLVSDNEAVVGAELGPRDAPEGLVGGVDLFIVIRPEDTVTGGGEEVRVEGWLRDVGDADENTGDRQVSLVVPRTQAADVSSAAADERLSLVALGG